MNSENEKSMNTDLMTMETENSDDNLVLSAIDKINNYELGENPFLALLEKAIALPGVKINRAAFLMDIYNFSGTEVESEDFFERITLEQMDNAAKKIIATNVTASSAMAFALGLPGGLAMAGAIPADIMQNFAFSLRLAQQLAYVYGFDNLFVNNEMTEQAQNKLIAFLGIMFATSGSGTVLRAIAPNIGKYAAKQTLKTPLMKTVWYPMLKKITKAVASKTITKKGLSGFVAKVIPVVGGVASAGISISTMIPMANRLKNELRKYYLSDDEILEIEEKEQ